MVFFSGNVCWWQVRFEDNNYTSSARVPRSGEKAGSSFGRFKATTKKSTAGVLIAGMG
jgi:hypothetical protein